ncbi:MAG: hypothetical protein R6X13_00095 [bacterium]
MRRRWSLVLLGLSLLGNVIVMGFFLRSQLRMWYRPETPPELRSALEGIRQFDLRVLVERYRWPLDSLKLEMALRKHDLEYLQLSAPGDTAGARRLLDERAALQKQVYRLMVESAWSVHELPEPRRRRMLGRWREMTGLPRSDSAQ